MYLYTYIYIYICIYVYTSYRISVRARVYEPCQNIEGPAPDVLFGSRYLNGTKKFRQIMLICLLKIRKHIAFNIHHIGVE